LHGWSSFLSHFALDFVNPFVEAGLIDEFVVGADFLDAAIFQNDDEVGVFGGGDPVGDDKGRGALFKFLQVLTDGQVGFAAPFASYVIYSIPSCLTKGV